MADGRRSDGKEQQEEGKERRENEGRIIAGKEGSEVKRRIRP